MGQSANNNAINILHVDDSRDYLLLAKARLSKLMQDLSIDWAESGTDALKAIRSKDYNCVVCDYHMPDMNGLKLLEILRGAGDNIPFIFLSSSGDQEIVDQAKETGANGYCLKEFGPQNFARLFDSIVSAISDKTSIKSLMKKRLSKVSSVQHSHKSFS